MEHGDHLGGRRKRGLPASKAKTILEHGEVRGHALTPPQKGFFGLVAGGGTPTRLRRRKKR